MLIPYPLSLIPYSIPYPLSLIASRSHAACLSSVTAPNVAEYTRAGHTGRGRDAGSAPQPDDPTFLVGARFAIQMIAILTVALRSSVDLSGLIGSSAQLLWIEYVATIQALPVFEHHRTSERRLGPLRRSYFFIFHFATIFIVLAETAVVHVYLRQGKTSLAMFIDTIFRNLLPLVMYPLCILGLVLWALIPSETVGFTIVLCAIALPVVGGCLWVGYDNRRHMNNKRRLARSLVDADLALFGAKEDWPALREAFDLFDIDNSGDIDSGEVRALLVEMYPRMPMRHRNTALQLRSGGDQVRFEDFDVRCCSVPRLTTPPPLLKRT